MAKLRMFANLREASGLGRVDVPGDTVGEVIETASQSFGTDFTVGLEGATVWVNDKPARSDDPVGEHDEIVLLSPVSGGSQPATVSAVDLLNLLPLAVIVVAVMANLQSQALWAAALVGIVALWAFDLNSAFATRGRLFAPLPVAATAAGGAMAAHALGATGYAFTLAVAVAVCLGWGIAFDHYRQVEAFAPTLMAGLLGGLAVSSLVLSRSAISPDDTAVAIFLVSAITGMVSGALIGRMPALPFLDPFSTTAIVAVLGAVIGAAVWDADIVGYLLIGLGIAVALVAGSGLSSMMRVGQVRLTERAPGILSSLDGVVLAAAFYFPLIRVIL